MPLTFAIWHDVHYIKLNIFWNVCFFFYGGQCLFFDGLPLCVCWFFSLVLLSILYYYFLLSTLGFIICTLFAIVYVCSENGIFNHALHIILWIASEILSFTIDSFYWHSNWAEVSLWLLLSHYYFLSLDRQVCFSMGVKEQWLLRVYWDFKPC